MERLKRWNVYVHIYNPSKAGGMTLFSVGLVGAKAVLGFERIRGTFPVVHAISKQGNPRLGSSRNQGRVYAHSH